MIETSLIKARRRDRTELLKLAVPTNATKESTFYFITTHFPGPNSPRAIVEKNWPILAKNRPTRNLYDAKIIYGKRRPHNLRDHLVTAKVKPVTSNLSVNQNTPHILNNCTSTSCRYCPLLDSSGTIKSHSTATAYTSRKKVSCKCTNLIYCITCIQCGKQYVGQTKCRLMDRFQAHMRNVTVNKVDDTIGRHFNVPGHHKIADMKIHILDFIHAHPESRKGTYLRNTIEINWMHRLNTIEPRGLNIMDC